MQCTKVPNHPTIEQLFPNLHYQASPPDDFEPILNAVTNATHAFSDTDSLFRIPGLVNSDFNIAWCHLNLINSLLPKLHDSQDTASRIKFVEWGSGLGVVSLLASRFDWNVTGIDIEKNLVQASTKIAQEFNIDAQFHEASYKPTGFPDSNIDDHDLLVGDGFGLFDFDIIYGYFWPAEIDKVREFFFRHAKPSTLFMLYKGGIQFELYRCNS